MRFREIKNDGMSVKPIAMRADEVLRDNKGHTAAYPLPNKSGFCIQINGYSMSGKTTLLLSLLSRKTLNSKNEKMSYRGMFDKIIYVSPSSHTIPTSNPIHELRHKYSQFDEDVLEKIEDLAEANLRDNDDDAREHMLLILDDVSSSIRKDRRLETHLAQLLQNRRHLFLSCIIISQKVFDVPPSIRSNLNGLIFFLPKTNKETDAIMDEYMPMKRDECRDLFKFVFDKKHNFMFVDMSLSNSSAFEFFKNFNKIETVVGSDDDKIQNKMSREYKNGETKTEEIEKAGG